MTFLAPHATNIYEHFVYRSIWYTRCNDWFFFVVWCDCQGIRYKGNCIIGQFSFYFQTMIFGGFLFLKRLKNSKFSQSKFKSQQKANFSAICMRQTRRAVGIYPNFALLTHIHTYGWCCQWHHHLIFIWNGVFFCSYGERERIKKHENHDICRVPLSLSAHSTH